MFRTSIVVTLFIVAFWETSKIRMIGIGVALPIRSSLAFASDSGYVGFGITSSRLLRARPLNFVASRTDRVHTIYNEMQARIGGIGWKFNGGTEVIVLNWFYVLVLPLGLFGINLRHRRHLVAETRRCATCGYDLRATPERCPECGTVTPRPFFSDVVPLDKSDHGSAADNL